MKSLVEQVKARGWKKKRWGNWRYTSGCLVFFPEQYEITLERLDEKWKAVHWVLHLNSKGWIRPRDIWDFASATKEMFGYDLSDLLQEVRMFPSFPEAAMVSKVTGITEKQIKVCC